ESFQVSVSNGIGVVVEAFRVVRVVMVLIMASAIGPGDDTDRFPDDLVSCEHKALTHFPGQPAGKDDEEESGETDADPPPLKVAVDEHQWPLRLPWAVSGSTRMVPELLPITWTRSPTCTCTSASCATAMVCSSCSL